MFKIFSITVFLVVGSCTKSYANKIQISTTIPVIGAIIEDIVRDYGNVHIISCNADNHHAQLSARDFLLAKKSDFLVIISRDFEHGVSKLFDNHKKALEVANLEGMILHKYRNTKSNQEYVDYHLWLDPNNAITIAETITTILSSMRPGLTEEFNANMDYFKNEVIRSSKSLSKKLNQVAKMHYFASHDEYRYFYKYMNLNDFEDLHIGHEDDHLNAKTVKIIAALKGEKNKCVILEPELCNSKLHEYLITNKVQNICLGAEKNKSFQKNSYLGSKYAILLENIGNKLLECDNPLWN